MASYAAEHASWQFSVNREIGSVKGQVQLPDGLKPEPVLPEVHVNCGEATAESLRALAATPAPSVPKVFPLALFVVQEWVVHPPRAPEKAKEDALVSQWKDIDAGFRGRGEKVRACLAAFDQAEKAAVRCGALVAGIPTPGMLPRAA